MKHALKILKDTLTGYEYNLKENKEYLKETEFELKEYPGDRYNEREKRKTLKKIKVLEKRITEIKEAIFKLKK